MCMSAASSSSASLNASSIMANSAGTTGSIVPAMGDDAADGALAIRRETGFDPADPLDQALELAAQLHAQLQQAQQLTAGGGGATSGTSFAEAAAQRSNLQLQPMTNGAAVVANLDAIVQARAERTERLGQALQGDPTAGAEEQLQLQQEQQLLKDTQALRDKLATMAETIDATEAEALLRMLSAASEAGTFNTEQLAAFMIQVEGSALGMPASYLQTAMKAQELLAQTRADIDAVATELASTLQSPDAQLDEQSLGQLQEMTAAQAAAHEALRANFELAKQDPGAAQAQLEQGLLAA